MAGLPSGHSSGRGGRATIHLCSLGAAVPLSPASCVREPDYAVEKNVLNSGQ